MEIANPAFDYDGETHNYSAVRKADPRIGQYVENSLSDCNTILNIGAGVGAYEPADKYVIAVEPSSDMRAKRLAMGRNPAVNASADDLPFDDDSFDAAIGILTIHHWPDLEKGLLELVRVSRKKISIVTYDPDKLDVFWNIDYFPDLIEIERSRYPKLDRITACLGQSAKVTNIWIPLDCTDGFQEAFYGRPEAFLDKDVRKAQSAWGFLDKEVEKAYVQRLEEDLASGNWDNRYESHRRMPFFEGAFRLLEFELTK